MVESIIILYNKNKLTKHPYLSSTFKLSLMWIRIRWGNTKVFSLMQVSSVMFVPFFSVQRESFPKFKNVDSY